MSLEKLKQKSVGFKRLLANCYDGVRRDASLMGRLSAMWWHAIPIWDKIRHYLGLPPIAHPCQIGIRGIQHRIWLRPGTSDYQVYRQVFADLEYAGINEVAEAGFILDCGANIGLASVYFLNRFPRATVLAVEPDGDNAVICARNLQPYGSRVKFVQGGIWSHRCKLVVVPSEFGAGNKWGIQVRPQTDADSGLEVAEAFDLPSLLELAGKESIDVLKMDVERSELAIFSTAPERWLPFTKNLVIELHGDDCATTVFSALQSYHYELQHLGDLTYCLGLTQSTPGATLVRSGVQ
jgi:FkbM family methyltransferase